MKIISEYKRNVIASHSKCFWSSLLDYGLTFILSFLLFWVFGSLTLSNLPLSVNASKGMQEASKEGSDLLASTHLVSYNDDNRLLGIEDTTNEFIEALAKTYYYAHDLNFYSGSLVNVNDTYLKSEEYAHDGLAYYFCEFKLSEGIGGYIYEGNDLSSDKFNGLYEQLVNYDLASAYFGDSYRGLSPYYCLSANAASLLRDYFVYEDTSNAVIEVYNYFRNGYISALSVMVNEVESLYTPYINLMNEFDNNMNIYYGSYFVTYSICLVVAFILLETIFPLIFKGRTVGLKAFRLAYATIDENEPSWYQYLFKSLLRFPIHYSGLFLGIWLFDSSLLSLIFTLNFGGWFYMSYLLLVSVLYSLSSLILFFIKKEHQGISEFGSGLLIKDTEMIEVGTPEEEKIHG